MELTNEMIKKEADKLFITYRRGLNRYDAFIYACHWARNLLECTSPGVNPKSDLIVLYPIMERISRAKYKGQKITRAINVCRQLEINTIDYLRFAIEDKRLLMRARNCGKSTYSFLKECLEAYEEEINESN